MGENQKFTVAFVMLSTAAIAGGMGLKEYIEYAPTIGWILALVFQISALYFAIRWRKEHEKKGE
ncbi:hypothetical protein [Bacillus sp. CGMCC 1.16541]|uniref:hypothetical protein n=1 Tax=Bacillus sp. CGMCC 1.16541 TaxID=2185143 RepID=UPI000D7373A4|nr:hypothetical protein [Bacillus sp. CGMCC 1.16541]